MRTLYCWVLSRAESSTIFKVFGMTQHGIETRSPRPLVNILLFRPMSWCGKIVNLSESWADFDPSLKCPACLATVKCCDTTKKFFSVWQYTYIHIYMDDIDIYSPAFVKWSSTSALLLYVRLIITLHICVGSLVQTFLYLLHK